MPLLSQGTQYLQIRAYYNFHFLLGIRKGFNINLSASPSLIERDSYLEYETHLQIQIFSTLLRHLYDFMRIFSYFRAAFEYSTFFLHNNNEQKNPQLKKGS